MSFMAITSATAANIHQRWAQLDQLKSNLHFRSEQYAAWTLPYIFPPTNAKSEELQSAFDSLGARATNNLANKIAMTLFTPYGPFFRLNMTDKIRKELKALKPRDRSTVQQMSDEAFADAERASMRALEKLSYRTAAVMSCKQLIVTGNSLVYHPPHGGMAQTYGLRNYCVSRDVDGTMVELMTKDEKSFETFAPEVQAEMQTINRKFISGQHQSVIVYTYVSLQADGKYHVRQSTPDVLLSTEASFPKHLLPWIPLTWNLVRGEDYGRGLVEDFAGAFHALEMLTESLVTGAAIAADIKILVDPASALDPEELNASRSGSYHTGRKDDLTYTSLDKQQDFQLCQVLIDNITKQISQAFLLIQGTTRDAERVTATEIRRDAQELETSLGGIYSRLAEEWQRPLARILLDGIKFLIGNEQAIEPTIVTGLDSLARAGDLDNLQMFLGDLSMLKDIPEQFLMRIHPGKFLAKVGTARGVDYLEFMMTEEEVAVEQQRAMQQQQQLMAAQGQSDMKTEAAKAAFKEQE